MNLLIIQFDRFGTTTITCFDKDVLSVAPTTERFKMRGKKEPLYRKVNTRTHHHDHHKGGHARWERNTKAGKNNESMRGSMHSGRMNGLDYKPLFRFLLSKVGQDWNEVHSEAVARLDKEEPIYWLVARTEDEKRPTVGIGESSYFSGLYIDENNRLAIVDPSVKVEDLEPYCSCCTHTFNGKPFVKKYRPWWERDEQ